VSVAPACGSARSGVVVYPGGEGEEGVLVPRWPGPRKYDPLADYLAQVPDDQVTLTLAEIETILGAALPGTARSSAFWSNYEENPPARAWRRVGWRTARQRPRQWVEAVTFVRVGAAVAATPPTPRPYPRP
jgi:hypothetical protein